MPVPTSVLILLTTVLLPCQSKKTSYIDNQVLRISISDHEEADLIRPLENKFDFWTNPMPKRTLDVRVSPKEKKKLIKFLDKNDFDWKVYIKDVQGLIDEEENAQKKARAKLRAKSEQEHMMDWESYHPLEEIYKWFDYLEGI